MKKLTKQQCHILLEKGTEPAFTGKYWNNKKKGEYICAACRNKLFSAETKYDSGTGWPSFYKPMKEDSIDAKEDKSLGIQRIEIVCKKCGGHLGHVFDDGPKPTGKRYCINSAALDFKEK